MVVVIIFKVKVMGEKIYISVLNFNIEKFKLIVAQKFYKKYF